MPGNVTFVEAEGELVNVPAKMLWADMMEGAIDAALEDGPNAFDAVGRDAIAHELASAVIDGLVIKCECSQALIAAVLICVQDRSRFNARLDFGLKRCRITSADWLCLGPAIAFPHAENCRLADRATSGMELLVLVLVPFHPADVGLIDFNDAASFSNLSPQASRSRPRMNQAVFCVTPISLASCIDEIPLRAVTTRYIA